MDRYHNFIVSLVLECDIPMMKIPWVRVYYLECFLLTCYLLVFNTLHLTNYRHKKKRNLKHFRLESKMEHCLCMLLYAVVLTAVVERLGNTCQLGGLPVHR